MSRALQSRRCDRRQASACAVMVGSKVTLLTWNASVGLDPTQPPHSPGGPSALGTDWSSELVAKPNYIVWVDFSERRCQSVGTVCLAWRRPVTTVTACRCFLEGSGSWEYRRSNSARPRAGSCSRSKMEPSRFCTMRYSVGVATRCASSARATADCRREGADLA